MILGIICVSLGLFILGFCGILGWAIAASSKLEEFDPFSDA